MISYKNMVLALSVATFPLISYAQSSETTSDKINNVETTDVPPSVNGGSGLGTISANQSAPAAEAKLLPYPGPKKQDKIVIITGVRFSYPLVQKWIDDYNAINPNVQIIIESRGSSDPAHYDLLIEAYEPDNGIKKERTYL